VLANPDDDTAFLRAIAAPKREVGATTLEKLAAMAQTAGMPMSRAAGQIGFLKQLTPRAAAGLDEFSRIVESLRDDSQRLTPAELVPVLAERIELYSGERPIFDLYGVEDEIGRALDKQGPLKSGGYLVIDQTEAMTTVDVNTGSFLGQRNLEETVYRTNLEAAQAVARQLRLRNLGGIGLTVEGFYRWL